MQRTHRISGSTAIAAVGLTPAPNLRAWATHIQTGGQITEEEFADSPLTLSEQNRLQNTCSGNITSGSGRGRCTCGTGD